ncbi:MAG: DNA repair protein RecO [Pseudomonadota bacterium]
MEWTDNAVVLGVRKHGETSVIAELMTRKRGRHLGLVQGGRSRTMRPVLQPGNSVRATWRARLDEHLGTYRIEADRLRAAELMETAHATFALQTIACHLRLLPERDGHEGLYETLEVVLESLELPQVAGELLVRFELAILEELGFGLDLARCAATGGTANLVYVSPKSGRAVSAEAGAPWADKMLRLPPFLLNTGRAASAAPLEDLQAGFALSGYFLHRDVYGPRTTDVPSERASLIRSLERAISPERI